MAPVALDSIVQAANRAVIFVPEVICCSAYDKASIYKSLQAVGIEHYLGKPANDAEIKEVLIGVYASLAQKKQILGIQIPDKSFKDV